MNGAVMTPDSVARWWFGYIEAHHITGRVPVVGQRCSDEPPHSRETKRKDDDGRSARPHVSHFETLIHLILRR